MPITTKVVSSNPMCTTLCDKFCQWFSPGTPLSSTNKTDITEILLKVALNTINLNHFTCKYFFFNYAKNQHIFVYTCLSEVLEVSMSYLHFSLMFSVGEVKSPHFIQVWWAQGYNEQLHVICKFVNFMTFYNILIFLSYNTGTSWLWAYGS